METDSVVYPIYLHRRGGRSGPVGLFYSRIYKWSEPQ